MCLVECLKIVKARNKDYRFLVYVVTDLGHCASFLLFIPYIATVGFLISAVQWLG